MGDTQASPQNTEQLKKISLITYYGIIVTGHTLQKELMTQILAWEQQGIYPTSISGVFTMADYQTFKASVMTNVNKFFVKPSFDRQIVELKVGESKTILDTTGSFSNYESSPSAIDPGLMVNKQGNQLTVTATKEANKSGNIDFHYAIASSYRGVPLIYQHPYTQNMMVGRINDLTKTSLTVNVTKNGNARVRKVDETTKQPLAGAVFRFATSTGQVQEIMTNADGYATWIELLVDTKVTIQEIKAPDGYILDTTPHTMTIKANETTTIIKDNQEQLANLRVIKEDEETGNTPQGAAQLIGAVYELTNGQGETVGQITMEETDGIVQGQIKALKLGTYTLQEIEAPKGYTLDPTKYTVHLTYAGQNETVAIHSKTVKNRVIKGHIEGYKFGSRPLIPRTVLENLHQLLTEDRGIKPPLAGVELTATSQTTGKKYVETTQENGYFKFEDLPYDRYIVEETKGVDAYLLIEPFEVVVTEDGYTHFFFLEDKIIESRLHIIKVDEDTGEAIPYAGAQFKIFDTWADDGKGAFVSMQKPNDTESTTIFETNIKGEVLTTDSLPWGNERYELHEIKAPEGYLPLENPIIFSITENETNPLIRLEVPNRLARQPIRVIKRDRLNDRPLKNVLFELYKIEQDEETKEILMGEYATDKDGKIEVESLPYGKYKFIESEPLEGYLPLEAALDFSITVEKDGEWIVLEAYNEREELVISSLFTDAYGKKEIYPTVTNRLKDMIWIKGEGLEIGHAYTVVTRYKNTKNGQVISENVSTYTAQSKEDTFEVLLELKANALKDGEQLTATHIFYYEEEKKE
ncbi:SpaA isopeptide-forming pilin-related protein [Enterococcus durans]|uniref:SpaA isopeptide-forming pilin-related protein n=1 Tax=Enterococcus durans TaxID=53345 RepID=UPI0021AE6B6C|nr:SpaA isopeptide-forming pilin-related protein [Enterococcus durans]